MSQDIEKAMISDWIMDNWTVGKLIDCVAGKKGNLKTKEALRKDLRDLAVELAGTSPSPLERALAETAATSWFAYRMHEAHFADCMNAGGMSIAQSEHAQRKIDRAHRRYVSTLKALATVRRLALPALQINVAHRQQIAQLNGGGSS